MADVLQPKVDALWVLHRLLAGAPPRVFVLFSSVSAVAPKLASGVLDYAAANRFLDLFAQYQHARGHPQYRSIQWARWRQMGLARDVREVGAAGLALDAAQCFEALHRVERPEELGPIVCVAAEGRRCWPQRVRATRHCGRSTFGDAGGRGLRRGDHRSDAVRRELRTIVARELEIEESKLERRGVLRRTGDRLHRPHRHCRAHRKVARHDGRSERADQAQLDRRGRALPGGHARSGADHRRRGAGRHVNCRIAGPADFAGGNGALPDGADAVAVRPGFPVAVIGIACRFPGRPTRRPSGGTWSAASTA